MIDTFGPPVFGLVQELIALVFVLVSVIGWIIRQVQGNNQQMPPPVQRPGRRRDERVNDEIDNFLQQINRNPDQQKPAEQARPANRPKPPGNRNQGAVSQRASAKPPQQPPAPAQSRRVREENAERPLAASAGLGSSLTQHVREHMAERVVKEAQRDVGQDVKDSVQKHMASMGRSVQGSSSPARVSTEELFAGKGPGPSQGGCCTGARAEGLKKMLRNPESIRQAVIIQEILNRPKCLR